MTELIALKTSIIIARRGELRGLGFLSLREMKEKLLRGH
jgi:hypothetical protein